MKVEDPEQALTEAVCSRVREQLAGVDAELAEAFARQFYRWVAPEDVAERDRLDLYGVALGHFNFARERAPGTPKVRVYNPRFEEHGWQSTHTAVEIVTDDMPFLIDSVSMELNRRGCGVHLIIHPVLSVRRDAAGRLLEILTPGEALEDGAIRESVIHAEVARQTEPERLSELEQHLERVIGEVCAAVEDWQAMRTQAVEAAAELGDEDAEAAAFMEWLAAENFTFLGHRSGDEPGLGILREPGSEDPTEGLTRGSELLTLTKANTRSTVHRAAYLDFVGVGERVFLGLYTHTAYRASPTEIPILRRRVARVLERAAFPPGSHNEKALLEILDTYPRDELFQISDDELFEIAMGILHLGERQRLRLFARARPVRALLLDARVRAARPLQHREPAPHRGDPARPLTAHRASTTRRACRSRCSCGSISLRTCRPARRRTSTPARSRCMLVAATRSWADDLEEALVEELGEAQGGELFQRYGDAFPAAYRADWVARSALADIVHIEELPDADGLGISLYRPLEAGPRMLRAKLFRAGRPLMLSDVLPLFENMGVEVADERPYAIVPRGRDGVWIYDFGLTYAGEGELGAGGVRESFQDTFVRAWRGDVENDGFNRLVLGAALTWREVTVLRAIAKYLRQARITFSDHYVEQALVRTRRSPACWWSSSRPASTRAGPIARTPAEARPSASPRRSTPWRASTRTASCASSSRVIRAILRTNYFQTGPTDGREPPLVQARSLGAALAYRSRARATRSSSTRRGPRACTCAAARWRAAASAGPTARGLPHRGARSDEGADGEERGDRAGGREGRLRRQAAAGRAARTCRRRSSPATRRFIRGLLDLTDNIDGGEVVARPAIVRYDGDDPYLVVAADKGTATFSDIANGIALEYGLLARRRVRLRRVDRLRPQGDGHHRARRLGVGQASLPRARARRAVRGLHGRRHRRHVRRRVRQRDAAVAPHQAGRRVQPPPHLPRPEPGRRASFEERRRLFELPESTWDDYDREADLAGRRRLRPRREVDPALARRLARRWGSRTRRSARASSCSALLRAPVDLLWNGGIGTYVKASARRRTPTPATRRTTRVRVDATELRAKVVGEGGNLGVHAARAGRVRAGRRPDQHGRDRQLRPASTARTTR